MLEAPHPLRLFAHEWCDPIPNFKLHALLFGSLVMMRNGGTAWIRLQTSKQVPNCDPYLSCPSFTVSLPTLWVYGRHTSSKSVMTCHVYCKPDTRFMHQLQGVALSLLLLMDAPHILPDSSWNMSQPNNLTSFNSLRCCRVLPIQEVLPRVHDEVIPAQPWQNQQGQVPQCNSRRI